jgi:hypothetical protein
VKSALAALLAAWALAGCAIGRNFERPDPDMLRLGQSRYAELVRRLGPPYSERLEQHHGRAVREVEYSYVTTYDPDPPYIEGGIPNRTLRLYFLDGLLVGHLFDSSWRADHTDFDLAKAPLIVKGKSTRQEVVALLGRPAGQYIYPMVDEPNNELFRYFFTAIWYPKYGHGRVHRIRKWVQVEFDPRGVVSRMDAYDSSRDPAN